MTGRTKTVTRRHTKAKAETIHQKVENLQPSKPKANVTPAKQSKIDDVVTLLARPEGASLGEISALTGWQPHSARAALTGLRKKGHQIERTKRDDLNFYRIATAQNS